MDFSSREGILKTGWKTEGNLGQAQCKRTETRTNAGFVGTASKVEWDPTQPSQTFHMTCLASQASALSSSNLKKGKNVKRNHLFAARDATERRSWSAISVLVGEGRRRGYDQVRFAGYLAGKGGASISVP